MAFASAGLPGLSGFVGEFTVLLGSYLSLPALAVIAGFGVVLAAVYLLWAYERMFTGKVDHPENQGLRDLGIRELAIVVPLVLLVIAIGVYPKPMLDRVEPSVEVILDRVVANTDYEVPEYGRVAEVAEVNERARMETEE
jgi:NADH-quinone oxidoreductase subunit M